MQPIQRRERRLMTAPERERELAQGSKLREREPEEQEPLEPVKRAKKQLVEQPQAAQIQPAATRIARELGPEC